MKKLILFTAILATMALGQNAIVRPTTLADITGDGSAHQLQSTGRARWVQFVAGTSNTGSVRVGDSAAAATRGVPIAAGAGFMFPPIPADPREGNAQHFYDLSSIYYLAQSGDKVSVTWGN